jgi:hypothetical protein
MTRQQKEISATDKALLTQALPYMALSHNVYRPDEAPTPMGWKPVATTDEIQKERDGFCARIYERFDAAGKPHYAIAFRGTNNILSKKDLIADVRIFFTRLPPQYERALKFVEDFCREKNVNPADMIYTGHSLGGYLATTVGATFNSKNIWTFNAPAPDAPTWRNIAHHRSPDIPTTSGVGWVDVRANNDFISRWGYYGHASTITIDTSSPPHGLDTLYKAASDITNGKPVSPALRQRGFLKRAFNMAVTVVSAVMARSRVVGLALKFIMAVGPGEKPRYRFFQSPPPPSGGGIFKSGFSGNGFVANKFVQGLSPRAA